MIRNSKAWYCTLFCPKYCAASGAAPNRPSAAVTSRRAASASPPACPAGRPLRLLVIACLSPVCSVLQGPLFLPHAHLDFGAHVRMQLDTDAELPQRPDRLREVHPPLVDADPELFQLALDVARGDRAEQLVLFPDLHREGEVDLRDAGRLGFRGALLRGALLGDALRFVSDLLLVGVGRQVGEALRQEIIARVAVLYLDHVAGRAEMLYVFSQDYFHSPSSSQWFKPTAESGLRAIKAWPRQASASPARLSTMSQSGQTASSRTAGSKAGYSPGATSTTYRTDRPASRVASHCTSVQSPPLVRATSSVTPAAA